MQATFWWWPSQFDWFSPSNTSDSVFVDYINAGKQTFANICPTFGSPDVTRPQNNNTRTHAHLRAHASASPGGFSSPKYTCLLGYSLMREGGEKENKPSLRRCASFKQDSVYRFCSLRCISNNGGVGRRQHETARVCMHVCPRESDSGAQRRNIRAVLFTPRLLCVSSAMVKLDSHVWRPARLLRGRRLLTLRVPLTPPWGAEKEGRKIPASFPVVSFSPARELISSRLFFFF